jgi:hypothetical protein
MRTATPAIEYRISVEPEQDDPEGHFATGDDAADAEIVEQIRKDAEWSEWAWCVVKVSARFNGFEGVAYLGACSYKDEADFKTSGYYEDMQAEAREDLEREIEEARKGVAAWDNRED